MAPNINAHSYMHAHPGTCIHTCVHAHAHIGCLLKSPGLGVEHTHGQAVVQKCLPQHLIVLPSEQDSPAFTELPAFSR